MRDFDPAVLGDFAEVHDALRKDSGEGEDEREDVAGAEGDDDGGHLFILVIMLWVKLKHDLVAIAGEINLLIKLYMSYHF